MNPEEAAAAIQTLTEELAKIKTDTQRLSQNQTDEPGGSSRAPITVQMTPQADLSLQTLIPLWGGQESEAAQFFRTIDTVAVMGRWSVEQKRAVLTLKLTGEALLFSQERPAEDTYADLKKHLQDRFVRPKEAGPALKELMSMVQGTEESARSYAERIIRKATYLSGLGYIQPDELLREIFLDGLRQGIGTQVRYAPVGTFAEALTSGERIEKALERNKHIDTKRVHFIQPPSDNESEIDEVVKTKAAPVNYVYTPERGDQQDPHRADGRKRSPGACPNCGQTGHWLNQCPQIRCYRCDRRGHMARGCKETRGRGRERREDWCYNCQRTGHYAKDCPERKGKGNDENHRNRAPRTPTPPRSSGQRKASPNA